MNKGKAVIFSAPSGAGKTTIVKHLLQKFNQLKFSISATTRSSRPGEVDGRDYYFLDLNTFRKKIDNHAFYEWEEVYPNMFYGTLKEEVERIWKGGNHVVFDVDVVGGINLKQALGNTALAIFVSVSGTDILEQRLKSRNTESPETLETRLSKAKDEMAFADQFDYVLINDSLDEALNVAEKKVLEFLMDNA